MKKYTNYERYGNYIINRGYSLGSGTFGKVYKGYRIISYNSFGNYERLRLYPIAIKYSYCEASNYQEINILKILTHPNIIRYIDYKIHGNSLFMIMELCEQGTLEDLLMELPYDENLNDLLMLYYAQVVAGIKFMYEKNILHRDIKPSNILIKDNVVKIADFGTSKLKYGKYLRTLVGTPLFSSPYLLEISLPSESYYNSPIKSTYTEKSDIWSLGLVLYMMFNYQKNSDQQGYRLRKSLPWSGKHAGYVLKNIYTQPLVFRNPTISENIKQIITKMLQINPLYRMSFKYLFELPYFQPPRMREMNMNLHESNLAISKTYMPDSSYDCNELSLYEGKEYHNKAPYSIYKKQIDNELMKMLYIKDSEHYEEDEIKEAIYFYTLLLNGLQEVKSEYYKDDYLLFLVYKKLYELQSWRLWHIDYQKKLYLYDSLLQMANLKYYINKSNNTIMKIDYEQISQLLKDIQGHYSFVQPRIIELKSVLDNEKFLKLVEKPDIEELLSKEKVIVNFIKPDNKLLNEIKLFIKRKLTEDLLKPFVSNRIKCNMDLTAEVVKKRQTIHLIYDLFMAIEFEFSWKLKGQLNSSYGKKNTLYSMKDGFFYTYKHTKQSVNIKQIISRVKIAYDSLKISAVKDDDEN